VGVDTDKMKMSSATVWNGYYDKSGCLIRRQIVPHSRSSCTEGSVPEVGARPTDEKRIRVSAERSLQIC